MEIAPIHLELARIKMFVVPVGSFSNIPHRARYTPYHKQAWHMNEVLKSESVCGYLLRQAECRGILSAGRVSIDSTFLFIAWKTDIIPVQRLLYYHSFGFHAIGHYFQNGIKNVCFFLSLSCWTTSFYSFFHQSIHQWNTTRNGYIVCTVTEKEEEE